MISRRLSLPSLKNCRIPFIHRPSPTYRSQLSLSLAASSISPPSHLASLAALLPTSPNSPAPTKIMSTTSQVSQTLPSADSAPTPPTTDLTAKQVRELRRLCRKTANRAEYDDRSVQVRQIASIVAMGAPSLARFAPRWSARSELQAWVDSVRADGADWRDERILLPRAVEELRDWDRLLKVWAEEMFGTDGAAVGATAQKTPVRAAAVGDGKAGGARNSMALGAASPLSIKSPAERGEQELRTPAAARLRRVASGSVLGTPITPGVSVGNATPASASRPKLVPAPTVSVSSPVIIYSDECSDSGEDAHSAVSSESEDAGQGDTVPKCGSSSDGKAIRRTVSARKPLGALSISRTGNVINVELPPRLRGHAGNQICVSEGVVDENASPALLFAKPGRDIKTLSGKMETISVKDSAATGCDRPRDWSSLRRSVNENKTLATARTSRNTSE